MLQKSFLQNSLTKKPIINNFIKNNSIKHIMLDIITIGSSTMDVFVQTNTKTLKIRTKKDSQEYIAFPFGSKILINDLEHHTGGGGTNTAITFADVGLKTGFLGNIGEDHNGDKILKELKEHKIKFLGKRQGKTGFSVILDAEQDRTILAYKGGNNLLPIELGKIRKVNAKNFYIASVTGEMFKLAQTIARTKNKSKIFFNPSSYMTKKGIKYLSPILKKTFCLILNAEEAELLTNHKGIKDNLKELAKKIVLEGIVIITQSSKGAYVYYNNKIYSAEAKKVKVKETTGAGDAFASGFVSAFIHKKTIQTCIKAGLNNAESTIQHLGAKQGLLKKDLFLIAEKDNRNVKIV